jgi:GPH family glycoside/pentoside/hexuronide:cation symporter
LSSTDPRQNHAADPPPLGLGARLLYASAHFGISALAFSVIEYLGHFYKGDLERGLPPRVEPALFAVALLAGRLLDAVTDPLVGHWSDTIRTRWGRRKPFMAVGIPLTVLSFIALWWTPDAASTMLNFAYVLTVLSIFFLGFTLVSCPYLALLPEIVRSDRDRVGLASLQAVFNVLGNIAGAVVGGALMAKYGAMGMGIVLAGASGLTFVLGLMGPHELHPEKAAPSLRLSQSLRATFGNRNFLHYGGGFLLFWIGLAGLLANVPVIVSTLLGRTEAEAGALTGVALVCSVLCLPLVGIASARWGKRKVFLAALAWFAILVPAVGTVGAWPGGLSGLLQGIIVFALAGPPISALFVMPYALVAEVVDADEELTGARREAMYFGVNGFLQKAGLGLGGAWAALLWSISAQIAAEADGLRVSGLIAGAFALGGFFAFRGYRLGEVGG